MSTTLSVHLPPALRKWLTEEVVGQTGLNAEQFLRALLEKEKRRQERRKIETALEDGLDSGDARPLDDAAWKQIRTAAKKVARKKSR